MDNYLGTQIMLLLHAIHLQEEIVKLKRMELELLQLELQLQELDQPTPRRMWVKNWVAKRKRLQPLVTLFRDLQVEPDNEDLRSFIRMDYDTFQQLVRRLSPRIEKKHTHFREPISVETRLLITLTYLSEGGAYRYKKWLARVPHNTMSKIIEECCEAIYDEYPPKYLTCPTTPEGWKNIANRFQTRWQFPHTLGALDGKHVAIKCPPKSGSAYYNYKKFYSIVMMALVDADYKFIWVEVGSNGASSDGQIFKDCDLYECLQSGTLRTPADEPLPGDDKDTPYYFIGDDAFGIETWFMKPFSQRNLTREQKNFNYRLSRARRIVENAFGILANRFGCLLTTLRQKPKTVIKIVKACVILHNILRSKKPLAPGLVDEEDENHEVRPGYWRRFQEMHDMDELQRGNIGTRRSRQQRQYLAHYLSSPAGAVSWQDEYIDRHRP